MRLFFTITLACVALLCSSCDSKQTQQIAKAKAEASASNYTLKAEPVAEFTSQRPAVEERLFTSKAIEAEIEKVCKELTAMSDHFKKSATAVMVLVVLLKMLSEVLDSRGEESDLNFGRSGVLLVNLVSLDNRLLYVFHHFFTFL